MTDNLGNIQISDDVVSSIAGIAASKVDGVYGMTEGLAGGIAKILMQNEASKGVKVTTDENEVTIDISLVIEQNNAIPTVAGNVQREVKETVEKMTGLQVNAVNVHICGIHIPKPQKVTKEEPEEE